MLIGYWGQTSALEDDAKGILSVIVNSYPNHPWLVKCWPGVIHIQHMDFPANWGIARKVTELDHDAGVMKKEIVMAAGEFLERAALRRGRGDGEQVVNRVEGLPEKYQPVTEPVAPVEPSPEFSFREEPRPQAVTQ